MKVSPSAAIYQRLITSLPARPAANTLKVIAGILRVAICHLPSVFNLDLHKTAAYTQEDSSAHAEPGAGLLVGVPL